MQIGREMGWIIPTSGHRAYPYQAWALEDLADVSDCPQPKPHDYIAYDYISNDPKWVSWRDHYEASELTSITGGPKKSLVNLLGLIKPESKLRVRRMK